jgi:hypothetical protein
MPIVKSRHDSVDDGEILPPMPVIDPSELIGRTFLMDKEDGQRHRARILNVIDEEEICKRIGEHERELFRQPVHVQFVCSVNDDDYEEILSYNELMTTLRRTSSSIKTKTAMDSGTSSISSVTKVLIVSLAITVRQCNLT